MARNETTTHTVTGSFTAVLPDEDGKLTLRYKHNAWKTRWWIFKTMLKFLLFGKFVDDAPLEIEPDRIPEPRPVELGRQPPRRPVLMEFSAESPPALGATRQPSLDYLSGSRYLGAAFQINTDRSEWVTAYDIPSDFMNWPSHVYTSPRSASMAVLDALDSVEFDPTDILMAGQALYFRTVDLKDQIVPPDFNRRKPLYRLFRGDDGLNRLYNVLPDNTPGDEVDEVTTNKVMRFVNDASWRFHFWQAFVHHGKATIYEGSGWESYPG